MSSGDISPNQNGPRSGTTTGFLLDSNRWYIVYLKFVFEKGKILKKKIARKKDAYKIMSMLRVHANALICSNMVLTYFRISD